MTPRRILITYNTANDSRSVSGVLKHFLLVARAWIAQGIEVDFLVAKAGFPQIHNFVPEAGLVSSDNIFNADRYIGKTWAYLPAYAWRMVTPWFSKFKTYDAIYASSPFIFEVGPARVIRRRHKAVLATKFHHVISAQEKRTGLADRMFVWSERKTMRWVNREADLIVASTGPVLRDVKALEARLGLPPREILQVGYGLDLSLFLPPVEKPEFDVVILGRLHVHKGVLDLPEIWSRVRQSKPDAKLLIIGEGAHRPLLEQGLQKFGLTSSVTFTGGVPEREKNELLARSRIGLSLSFEEGWGLSVNEYLATGLPVVAYHLPIYDEVFPGLLETVPSGNKEAAAANILRLLQNQSLSESIGSRGREFVKRYDYRNVAEAELNGIRTALEKRRKKKEK